MDKMFRMLNETVTTQNFLCIFDIWIPISELIHDDFLQFWPSVPRTMCRGKNVREKDSAKTEKKRHAKT